MTNPIRTSLIILLFLFSHAILAETFDLVCDTPLHRNAYQFDTESKIVTRIGQYSYEDRTFTESQLSTTYNTVDWDTDGENVVWVTYDFTNPAEEDLVPTTIRHGTVVTIVFDLHFKYMTYTVLTRVRGLVQEYTSSRKRCYMD